ncbi:MAG: hypothetical protein U5K81_11825 [Trueperaceae bacterium]|nr:hypothetical protein [Trueperaceae bacterium]
MRATAFESARSLRAAPVLGSAERHLACRECMHDAGMPKSITIRDVPDDVSEELAARASRSGTSLQAYLRAELIATARRQELDVVLGRARERVERMGSSLPRDTILGHIEKDRR